MDAVAAFGITISLAGNAIAQIIDAGDYEKALQQIDVTYHGATGGYRVYIPSAIITPPKYVFTCNYLIGDTNGQRAVEALAAAKTAGAFAVTFPNGRGFSGDAVVENYKIIGKMEDQLKFEVTLQFTGALTDTYSASNNASALSIATATLYPAFAAGTYEYGAVSTGNTGTISVTFAAGVASLYKNGTLVQALTSGVASSSIGFGSDGDRTELEVVITESGKAPVSYKVDVLNAAA